MSDRHVPGTARVTRRAIADIVRPAVLGSYGVTGFVADGPGDRLVAWLRLADPGIAVSTDAGLELDLHLTVAFGLPVAEVARQADSAVRYALERALGRPVDRLTIHVGGMRYGGAAGQGGGTPEATNGAAPSASDLLAESLVVAVEGSDALEGRG